MARGNRLILDRYEPIGTAGVGGFGTVEIAWDPRIQRKVAIKTIRLTEIDAYRAGLPGAQAVAPAVSQTADRWRGAQPWGEYLESGGGPRWEAPGFEFGPDDYDGYNVPNIQEDPETITFLAHLPGLDEARTAAMLSDPRIVTVYDFEVRGRMAYLIMEYVEGITLTQLLADYADYITLDMVTAVFDAMAGALSVAHAGGVLHLDIKPDNIIVNLQGQAKVTDFGLATLADASGAGTTGGGTIGYMPLEQIRREHLDARSDEWSLASVTYEMLTGDNPFRVTGLDKAQSAIEDAELILPSLCWDNVDEQIDDVVFYALDPNREERYATVADFAEELDKFLGNAENGRTQLALVVADALGVASREQEEDLEEYAEEPAQRAAGFFARLFGRREPQGEDDFAYDDYLDENERSAHGRNGERSSRDGLQGGYPPLVERINPDTLSVLARCFAAVASGFVTFLALSNLPFVPSGFGVGAVFFIALGVIVVAAIAAILPSAGSLVAFALLGISLIACGHFVVGGVLVVVAALWWFFIGREGMASANVSLTMPLAGSIGAGSIVPFVAGAALPVLPAIATVAFAIVQAFVLGALGSDALFGWDAVAHWSFSRVNVSANAVAMLQQPSTWLMAASWVVATAVVSWTCGQGRRWLQVAGLIVGLVIVIGVSIIAIGANAPIIVSSIVIAIVLAAVLA